MDLQTDNMSYFVWVTSALMVYIAFFIRLFTNVNHVTNIRDLHGIRTLLAPQNSSIDDLLHARAAPNTRLVKAFNIDNTFVNPSPTVHSTFVREAKALLDRSTPRGDWTGFRAAVIEAVDRFAPRNVDAPVEFATFVQSVTFAAVAVSMFEVEPSYLDPADVALVARNINELWRLSKISTSPSPLLLQQVQERLHAWIPTCAERNPLDLLLPSYETMWRVVAATLANVYDTQRYRKPFEDFLAEPKSGFQTALDDTASVECIITESLRMHPPTKHLARLAPSLRLPPSLLPPFWHLRTKACVQAADVEALHRSNLWGPAPGVFDPHRHAPAHQTAEQRGALMPFGYGPLQCVARQWAPRAVGLIVAGILVREDFEIKEGSRVGGREGWDGWEVGLRVLEPVHV